MILKSVAFTGSAVTREQFPDNNLPQIVFSGRSNVGKSSFINALLNRKNIARVSQTPGKTRLVNFFLINELFYFVDIPGYGYASVSKQQLLDFQVMIETYLQTPQISMTVLLLDIRRIPNDDDILMYDYFKSMNSETLIVLTKADKLSNNKRINQINKIKEKLQADPNDLIIPISSVTKYGIKKVWEAIGDNVLRHSVE